MGRCLPPPPSPARCLAYASHLTPANLLHRTYAPATCVTEANVIIVTVQFFVGFLLTLVMDQYTKDV